jgi:prolyl-tRNA synthetase
MEMNKDSEFSEWYTNILFEADLIDSRYPVKGMYVWRPYGFKLRNLIYGILRKIMDEEHEEVLFPLLIPKNEFMKEAEHIRGFENEVFWVTRGGSEELDVPLALRPTSETAMYPMFKLWIRSHADLPLKIYQIVNTFRYETKHTRPLIRVREITSFKEAHTAHATWEEAEEQVKRAIEMYKKFYDELGIPYLVTKRPDWDKFPGADYTVAFDTIMPNGKTLQIGTVHHLGDNFARTFDIKYEDENGEHRFVHQTCYGISERCVSAVISIHGDSRGLILPPKVAPIQIVIVPILMSDDERAMEVSREIERLLTSKDYRVLVDNGEERPGAKFYKWERKGVPLRIEIGPRDVSERRVTLVPRDTLQKRGVALDKLLEEVEQEMKEIEKRLSQRAWKKFRERVRKCEDLKEAREIVGVALLPWCGEEDCGKKIEEETAKDLLGEVVELRERSRCIICGRETERTIAIAKSF